MATNNTALRMYNCAIDYLHDEKILSTAFVSMSPGQEVLDILALEIFLKTVLLLETGNYQRNHDYEKHWAKIPQPKREIIFNKSCLRYPGHADMGALSKALAAWKTIFVKGRYSYELQEDIEYYPFERMSLIAALGDYIEEALGVERTLPLDP